MKESAKQNTLDLAVNILGFYNVILVVNPNVHWSGCVTDERTIYLGTKGQSQDWLCSTLCHEIAHMVCYERGKYIRYNDTKSLNKMPARDLKRIAIKAELYTDKIGEEIFNLIGFNEFFEYQKSYGTEKQKLDLYESLGI